MSLFKINKQQMDSGLKNNNMEVLKLLKCNFIDNLFRLCNDSTCWQLYTLYKGYVKKV